MFHLANRSVLRSLSSNETLNLREQTVEWTICEQLALLPQYNPRADLESTREIAFRLLTIRLTTGELFNMLNNTVAVLSYAGGWENVTGWAETFSDQLTRVLYPSHRCRLGINQFMGSPHAHGPCEWW